MDVNAEFPHFFFRARIRGEMNDRVFGPFGETEVNLYRDKLKKDGHSVGMPYSGGRPVCARYRTRENVREIFGVEEQEGKDENG